MTKTLSFDFITPNTLRRKGSKMLLQLNNMNFLLLSLSLFNLLNNAASLYCYWNTGCPYKYLSSKTPYRAVRGDIRDSIVKLTGCEPVGIWGLVRHGKIYPGISTSGHMRDALIFKDYVVDSYDIGSSSLCAQDVDNLRNWSPDSKMLGQTHQLSEEGHEEVLGLGSRFKQAFPKLFSKLDKENYIFRPASGNWIEDSAKAFVSGLQNERLVIEKVKEDYDIMAPYQHCGKYQKDVLDNPSTYAEIKKYQETSEYLAMKDRVKRRIGINTPLSNVNITALYDWCRYTWTGTEYKASPWCALFTTEDLKVLEYADDLKHYFENGYGTRTNELFGKIPLADLLNKFQEIKDGKGKDIVTYFTDSRMIEMVYTALNLFNDERRLNGARKDPKRKWRNSKLSPFSSNLFAVLNRCQQNDYNVVFYVNEEALIPICKDGVCTWQEFENKLKPFLSAKTDC